MSVPQLIAAAFALGLLAFVLAPLFAPARRGLSAATVCPDCGPRPEPRARFCSNCGRPLPREGE